MQTNLTKINGEWAVEVYGAPDEEVFVKAFPSGREHASTWVRKLATGDADMPVFKKKGAKKAKSVKK
jgi:hypothetical protein